LRRMEPRDIVFLFRSLSSVAVYERELSNAGLDYYLVGGRLYFAQQEVHDLLNLLRAIENPEDTLSLFATLRSPFFLLNDDSLHLLATEKCGLWAALEEPSVLDLLDSEQREWARTARRKLTEFRQWKDRVPVAELLHRIFAAMGFDAATQFEFLGDRKLANLWKLIEMARTYDERRLGLAAFVERLANQTADELREEQAATQPEESNVIRLMTIHQAKGLEFPVVIVPNLNSPPRTSSETVQWHPAVGCVLRWPSDIRAYVDDGLGEGPFSEFPLRMIQLSESVAEHAEGRRLFYVAATRARDRLVLSAGFDNEDPLAGIKSAWLQDLNQIYELTTGQCRTHDAPGVPVMLALVDDAEDEEESQWEPPVPPAYTVLPAVHQPPAIWALPALERRLLGVSVRHAVPRLGEELSLRQTLDELVPTELRFREAFSRCSTSDFPNRPDAVWRGWREALLQPNCLPRYFGASVARREVEFMVNLFELGLKEGPLLRGIVDALILESSGWCLVGLQLQETPRPAWPVRAAGLQLAAWALHQATGLKPVRIELWDLVQGRVEQAAVQEWTPKQIVQQWGPSAEWFQAGEHPQAVGFLPESGMEL
ncbi:MAG: 3'-5' exonuclease, partial [Gemmataceae bacterium]